MVGGAKGVCEIVYEYEANGKVTLEAYFDGAGNPMVCKDGFNAIQRTYTKDGQMISEFRVFPEEEEEEAEEDPAA